MLDLLRQLRTENLISELNYQFARFIQRKQQPYGYSERQQNLALLLAAAVSFNVGQGHSCLRLDSPLALDPFGLAYKSTQRELWLAVLQKIDHLEPLAWQQELQGHIAFSHTPDDVAPLLFHHGRLYFYRYWQAEQHIADYLQQAVRIPQKSANEMLDKKILDRLFPAQTQPDWQKIAAATALVKPFCLISGGPGTGKTRTVALLLSALQLKQMEQGEPLLNISLAAPTGKAAARLKESIAANLQSLNLPDELKRTLPENAATLHSLLGIHPQSDTARHHARNPLQTDLLVVDEASMIDLFTFEKLLAALKAQTRLILLGDKDQLAAVEAGNVMAELGELITFGYSPAHSRYLTAVGGSQITPLHDNLPAICDSLCHLRHSYRFSAESGIGRLAAEINAQQAVRSWQILANGDYADLNLQHYPSVTDFSDKTAWIQHCLETVIRTAVTQYQEYLRLVKQRMKTPDSVSIGEIFAAFRRVRLLSALRVGEFGVEQLNQRIADALNHQGWVQFRHSRDSYFGKPILITTNAPSLHIFSGDIGIMLPDEQGKLRLYIDNGQADTPLSLSAARVPSHEPAYAMTVHKSQGSEFDHTLLVLPPNSSPILTKELLYTAVTRAKTDFTLFSNDAVWQQGVRSKIQRQSGLREMLQQRI